MIKMPVIFVGHGSPMNAILDNQYSSGWKEMAKRIPEPKAIISISAHWFTNGTKIMNEDHPKTIYDMYGFPKELYAIKYDVLGNPMLAEEVKRLIQKPSSFDNTWGIDHGTWSVLVHMYPKRDIPVFQISIDAKAPPQTHYQIGKDLQQLRNQGVLIFGTGNIVHNLRLVNWDMEQQGYDWAYEFDNYIKDNILKRNHQNIMDYHKIGRQASLAVPTLDHFNPLLYILGATDDQDEISIFNENCAMGSVSMTSYLFQPK
ncbi:MAG: 4,5-DOPA dioxygenase extradiol [Bacilli bacterium]